MSIILEKLQNYSNKGKVLEEIVVDIFESHELSNIQRQKGGSQYGFDVIGYKDRQCWKAECKNLNREVSVDDLAPKLIWHISGQHIDKFIIVSIFGLSNDARKLIESTSFSFDVEVWFGEYLELQILQSSQALERLDITNLEELENRDLKPIVYEKSQLTFDVFYSQSKPLSFDYLIIDEQLVKSFTDEKFKLTCKMTNTLQECLVIQEINLITVKFRNTRDQRILRQRTMRGIFEPVNFKVMPKHILNGRVDITKSKMLKLEAGETEVITLTLDKNMLDGYYEFILELNTIVANQNYQIYSNKIPVSKKSKRHNVLDLQTLEFYDSPAEELLNLDDDKWLKAKKRIPQRIKYLGPTMHDREYSSKTWKLHTIKLKKEKDGLYAKGNAKSRTYMNTNIAIKERIYSANDIENRMFKEWL